jgi:hypothetical protein
VVITVATWYVLGPGGAFGASGVFGAVGGSAGLFGSTLANGFASAAAAGFAAGGIQGGNIESAVYGAFSAVVFYGVGQSANLLADKYGTAFWGSGSPGRVVLHGAAGCASASVAGGSCGHGAISAAFAEAAGPNVSSVTGGNKVAGFVGAVVAGGGAARLAGGKFANGAATGAFSYLFNDLSHFGESMGEHLDLARIAVDKATNFILGFLPGAAGYECITGGCGILGWGIASMDLLPGGKGVSLGLRGLTHTIERHTVGGALSTGKSVFNVG